MRGHPRAAFVKEPLEDDEARHRDGEDELAEWVHGHPPLLWKDGAIRGTSCVRRASPVTGQTRNLWSDNFLPRHSLRSFS